MKLDRDHLLSLLSGFLASFVAGNSVAARSVVRTTLCDSTGWHEFISCNIRLECRTSVPLSSIVHRILYFEGPCYGCSAPRNEGHQFSVGGISDCRSERALPLESWQFSYGFWRESSTFCKVAPSRAERDCCCGMEVGVQLLGRRRPSEMADYHSSPRIDSLGKEILHDERLNCHVTSHNGDT